MAKKTTLMMDESLYAQVRTRAAAEGKSVSFVVAEAMREYLFKRQSKARGPIKLTVSQGSKWIGPVDPHSNAQMLDYLDDVLPLGKLR